MILATKIEFKIPKTNQTNIWESKTLGNIIIEIKTKTCDFSCFAKNKFFFSKRRLFCHILNNGIDEGF